MRRNYISPEFTYEQVYGSFNMKEQSSFFGSKMLEIEDKFEITEQNLIYYELDTNEQLDFQSENSLPPKIFDQVVDKLKNHTIKLQEMQSDFQKNSSALWEMEINIDTLFSNSIFATLKRQRTFEGLQKKMTKDFDVNSAIRKYIELNIRSRYRISRIDMYLDYVDLVTVNGLKYNNKFDQTIAIPQKKFTKFQTMTEFDESKVKIQFTQEKSASLYAFIYYFNIFFEKI